MGKLSKKYSKMKREGGTLVHSLKLENEMIKIFLEMSKAPVYGKISRT